MSSVQPLNSGAIVTIGNNDISNNNTPREVSVTTEIRLLPSWVRAQLGQIVEDRSGKWLSLMAAIPSTPPWSPGMPLPPADSQYARKYTANHIRLLEQEVVCGRVSASVGSGLNLLLEEWGCSGRKRPTLADLLALLDRVMLYNAASFLRRDLLKESTTDTTAEQFLDLDQLIEEKSKSAATDERLYSSISTTLLSDTNTTVNHSEIISSDDNAQLDNLLAQSEGITEASPSALVESSPIPDDEFLTLEMLAEEAKNPTNHVKKNPITLDEFNISIPHINFDLLHNITESFSDIPYADGGRRLGAGAYGVVYKADIPSHLLEQNTTTNIETGSDNSRTRPIAIKTLNFSDDRVDEQFKVEVEILSTCCHSNILQLEGYSHDGSRWCLLYTFMLNGNLQDRLACVADLPPLSPVQRLTIGHGTAEGLVYLHTFKEKPLIHRDVKSANILLDENLIPKLGDFGLVRIGGRGAHTETLVETTRVFGTSAYMAPESFRGDVSIKLDTFAYGVVLLEILTGLPPYDEHREGRDLLSHVQGLDDPSDALRLRDLKGEPWPLGLPQALYDIAKVCFEEKKNRPSMSEILRMWVSLLEKFP